MLEIIIWILAFIVAITIHETAHAWMADRLGDPTARLMGRLSLNPLVHYDPIGTTLLLVLVIMRAIGIPVIPFGWAKPVRFDPYNLKNPRRDSALISFAGPLANLILAIILGIAVQLLSTPFSPIPFIAGILYPFIILNVVLAIFNLIPIHPLDGGKILIGLLPAKDAYEADRFLNRYGVIILFLLIFPTFGGTSPIFMFLTPILNFILGILIPGNPII
jgi:Zn-dependent protease